MMYVILIVLVVYSLVMTNLMLKSYEEGLEKGQKLTLGQKISNYTIEEENGSENVIEEQNLEILMNNIEAYDGTDNNQQDFIS